MTARRLVAVDLFAGAGGLSLGFEQAGFDVALAVEYDPVHALVHKFNFPNSTILCRDIHKVCGKDISDAVRARFEASDRHDNWDGVIDVVVGGPSCQGFSVGGLRDAGDVRNKLLLEFARLVGEVRPRAFCLENVRGLLEPRFKAERDAAFKILLNAGYTLTGLDGWVNAEDFGVPQARKRVVIIGVRDVSQPTSLQSLAVNRLVTVREALEGLPVIENYNKLMESDEVKLRENDRLRRAGARSPYAREMSGVVSNPYLDADRTWNPDIVTGSLRTTHSAAVTERFNRTKPGEVEARSRLFRLDPDRPARTLRAGTGSERGAHTAPRPIHPSLPRVITVREAARVQGFPDWFRFSSRNWHAHRQIGNSVPPPLARAAATAILDSLKERAEKHTPCLALGDSNWLNLGPGPAAAIVGSPVNERPAKRVSRSSIEAPVLVVAIA